MAAALGLSNPPGRKECFEMARRFNIGMTFPSLPLKNFLAKQELEPAPELPPQSQGL
jgi:hypothetical protein